jgi:hypothetical protein
VPFVFCSGQQKSRAGPVSPDAAPQAAATASPVPAALLARAAGSVGMRSSPPSPTCSTAHRRIQPVVGAFDTRLDLGPSRGLASDKRAGQPARDRRMSTRRVGLRGWRLALRGDAGGRSGAVIAVALCRGWRLVLRGDAGGRSGAVIAVALCRGWRLAPRGHLGGRPSAERAPPDSTALAREAHLEPRPPVSTSLAAPVDSLGLPRFTGRVVRTYVRTTPVRYSRVAPVGGSPRPSKRTSTPAARAGPEPVRVGAGAGPSRAGPR